MTYLREVWYLQCKAGCPAQIPLPNQNPPRKPSFQKYWPMGNGPLILQCHVCGRLSDYSVKDGHPISEPWVPLDQRPYVFQKLTISCGHKNCGTRVVIHMQTERDIPDLDVMKRGLLSRPMPTFSCGHVLTEICGMRVEKIEDESED